MWRAFGRQRTSRVFADKGIAAEGSVEGGEETQDLSRVRAPRAQCGRGDGCSILEEMGGSWENLYSPDGHQDTGGAVPP